MWEGKAGEGREEVGNEVEYSIDSLRLEEILITGIGPCSWACLHA